MALRLESHYQTLGVGISATPEEIRSAYLRAARNNHPDLQQAGTYGVSGLDMQALNEAYAVLKDPVTRARYDRQLAMERTPCRTCGGAGTTSVTVSFTRKVEAVCADCLGAGYY